ncbi:MauE/DoxX family redox-associated membrane protein [Blastococcus saxobsidens]|uniref:DoxX family transporter n=1 Tax=Blastococcus saxobsidens (strain DD2) TaxID=1146883 RepID=H6RU58_BLASD|nr:MauE/DoxX family redox-associated membrane protein [Blastococcus saxobsidens]CCG05665.1 DoxX family transporter [Blastococcus saxobsidens DD2]
MPDVEVGGGSAGARRAVGPWSATAGRLLLGGVLLVAGALKVPDPAAAVRAVRAYQLLPEPLVAPVAFGLPVLEIAVGLALLAGVFVRTAALSVALLLVVFMAGVASAWARGLRIDCGCFGGGGVVATADTPYPGEMLRDLALLGIALLLARRPRSRLALGGAPPAHPRPDDAESPVPLAISENTRVR